MKLHDSSWAWLVVGSKVMLWRYSVGSIATTIVRSIKYMYLIDCFFLIKKKKKVTLQSTAVALLIHWVEGRPCHCVYRPIRKWKVATLKKKKRCITHSHMFCTPPPLPPFSLPCPQSQCACSVPGGHSTLLE